MILEHIALQIIEIDLELFYKNILNVKIESKSEINANFSNTIFTIPDKSKIVSVSLDSISFELFITSKVNEISYNHVCIQTESARDIYLKAKEHNFFTRTKKTTIGTTYFIGDSSGNIFELKQ